MDLQVVLSIFQCDFSNDFLILTFPQQWISPTFAPGRAPQKNGGAQAAKDGGDGFRSSRIPQLDLRVLEKGGGVGFRFGGWPPESQKNYGEMWGDMGKYGEIWDMFGFKHQKFRHV